MWKIYFLALCLVAFQYKMTFEWMSVMRFLCSPIQLKVNGHHIVPTHHRGPAKITQHQRTKAGTAEITQHKHTTGDNVKTKHQMLKRFNKIALQLNKF